MEVNVRTDFKEVGREGVDWIDLAQDRYKRWAVVNTVMNIRVLWVVSGFRREVKESCDLLAYYAASSGNFLPTFRYYLSVPSSGVDKQDGTDGFSRNVDKKLPLLAS